MISPPWDTATSSTEHDDTAEVEHRITLAAANGHLSDSRITLDTMRAARTIMLAAEQPRDNEPA